MVILAADHGEAFGEHQTTQHSKTLYQELVHIPLIIRTPIHRAQEIEDRVTLLDAGPTILDIFGLPTPSQFMGQSLVPFLEHKHPVLERPILAEGRLRRSIVTPDGLKVIDDPRRTVVEAYDLVADPNETTNLWGKDPRADEALLDLRTFFANNAYTKAAIRRRTSLETIASRSSRRMHRRNRHVQTLALTSSALGAAVTSMRRARAKKRAEQIATASVQPRARRRWLPSLPRTSSRTGARSSGRPSSSSRACGATGSWESSAGSWSRVGSAREGARR